MQRGTQGHVAEPREPTRGAGGAQVARAFIMTGVRRRKPTRGASVCTGSAQVTCGSGYTSPRGRSRGHHVARMLAGEGPTG